MYLFLIRSYLKYNFITFTVHYDILASFVSTLHQTHLPIKLIIILGTYLIILLLI